MAKSADLNTKINKSQFLDLTPALSFHNRYVYSGSGKLITNADAPQNQSNIWNGVWHLTLYIHNPKPIKGYFRINFKFGKWDAKDGFVDAGLQVLSEAVYYEGNTTGYSIEPHEVTGVTGTINRKLFEDWLDYCYGNFPNTPPQLSSLPGKIQVITGTGPSPYNVRMPMNMYVEIRLLSRPFESRDVLSGPVKYYYVRFTDVHPGTWDLILAPENDVFSV